MKQNASTYFFESNDPERFAQYVELRRRVFLERYPVLPANFGYPDETDRVSRFVYACHGKALCGGARLTLSAPGRYRRLPLEEGASLRENPELVSLRLDRRAYGEISRMAVEPVCADGLAISFGLGQELCRVAARLGADVIFSICPPGPARLNRRNAVKCRVRYEIYSELPNPYGIPMRLCAYTGIVGAYGKQVVREACTEGDRLVCAN